ncbi:MAG: SDR family oxidoreductase [Anaerolineales bacterium]|nr:SDR family oxidoreductase [Anaerolineales bacterium]
MNQESFFENAVILTGASRGIGRQLAFQLAEQGAWLSLAARSAEELQQVAEDCLSRGGRVLAIQTDVSIQSQCDTLVQSTVNEYGRIDTLINNAGITMWASFDELETLSPLEKIIQTNYLGSVYCTYYALPYLKATKGRIVGISSVAGKTGVPKRSGYAASKHAMTGFFDTLRIELEETGVSVTMIYPDFVATNTRKLAFGPDGQPLMKSRVREGEVMSAETCARLVIDAVTKRKREAILSTRGKLGQWFRLISPSTVDRIARRAIEKGR